MSAIVSALHDLAVACFACALLVLVVSVVWLPLLLLATIFGILAALFGSLTLALGARERMP